MYPSCSCEGFPQFCGENSLSSSGTPVGMCNSGYKSRRSPQRRNCTLVVCDERRQGAVYSLGALREISHCQLLCRNHVPCGFPPLADTRFPIRYQGDIFHLGWKRMHTELFFNHSRKGVFLGREDMGVYCSSEFGYILHI